MTNNKKVMNKIKSGAKTTGRVLTPFLVGVATKVIVHRMLYK